MAFSNPVVVNFLLLLVLIPVAEPQVPCSNRGTYEADSSYGRNLNFILSSLPSNVTSHGGFYNVTAGRDLDQVYALALCRGDLSSTDCYNCANYTSKMVTQRCPYSKEAIIWGEEISNSRCMIRYSNRRIFAIMETSPSFHVSNPNNITDNLDQFNQTLYSLMGKLVVEASSSDLKFATGDRNYTSTGKRVYGLVQCTPDISQDDCRTCLKGALGEMEAVVGGKEGGRVLRPSCLVWFELNQFYDKTGFGEPLPLSPPPPAANSSPNEPSSQGSKSKRTQTFVIITVVTVVILTALIVASIACIIFRNRRKQKVENESLQFSLSSIRAATDDFSEDNKLGQGGFGSVYKGVLPNGQEIAVKRLSRNSVQGEEEFRNEILLVAKLQHKNLVRILGFCTEGSEKILVYEFVRNGSLDHFIFDPIKRAQLNWETCSKIIGGIARGIPYLHEHSRLGVIHRDLKASNVLLDEENNPQISDFGMARLFAADQTHFITSRVAGTYGYMAPEYALRKRFSVKSDVFSFGVLILEIVSGKKNSWFNGSEEIEHLLSHAWKNWREGTISNLIDRTLITTGPSIDIMRCIHIGLLCVQKKVADRPTMSSVVLMLGSNTMSLPSPSEPGFLLYSSEHSDLPSLESDSRTVMSEQSGLNAEEETIYISVN